MAIVRCTRQGIKFNDEHATPEDRIESRSVEAKAEKPATAKDSELGPELKPMKPLVTILTVEEAEEALAKESFPQVRCGTCESVADNDEGHWNGEPVLRPKGSREVMIEHLVDV
jgi:hypothetical protein